MDVDMFGMGQIQTSNVSDPYQVTDLVSLGKRLGEATKLHIGNVYDTTLTGARRKRLEVVLVRDLEFLRIYDTRTGRVTASYPGSASYFHACAPHCISVRQSDGRTNRFVWQAISKQSPLDRKKIATKSSTDPVDVSAIENKWLRCLVEEIQNDVPTQSGEPKANSVETIGDVSCLESIMLDNKMFLLAAYKNGMLACYTHDLRIANSPMADTMMGENIILMTTMDAKRAADGMLKSVSNLQAAFNGTRLLAVVSKPADSQGSPQVRIRILQFSTSASDPDRPVAIVLLSQDLILNKKFNGEFDCMLHDQGMVYIWAHRHLQIFDMSKDLNRSHINLQFTSNITSVMRLDQNFIAVCTTQGFDRISLQFRTSQGRLDWPEPLRPSEITRQYESKLIDFDRKTDRILCLHHSKLIVISANGKMPVTVADFIDRGLGQTSITGNYQASAYQIHMSMNPRGDTKWDEWTEHILSLSECVKTSNTERFDTIFAKLLHFITSTPSTEQVQNLWLSPSQRLNNNEKISLIIGYIFEPVPNHKEGNKELTITIKILPRQTFEWLVKNGYMSSNEIQRSLCRIGRIDSQKVEEDAVVRALAAYDPSLATLEYFITHSHALSAMEAALAISYALNFGNKSPNSSTLAITSGQEMDIDVGPENSVTQNTLGHPVGQINNQDETDLLQISLLRLVDKDHVALIKAFRAQLSNEQMFKLIEFLRIEISKQGWLAEILYDSAYNSEGENETPGTISRLAKILGCILDALGMAPWLNGATSAENENLISWMKLEISAALEAVEEASYMSGILHEVSLFTKLLTFEDKDRVHGNANTKRIQPKVIDDLQPGSNALPAGLKPAGWLDVNVVKNGKVQKMSSRQIGHLKSKMVGVYSRERIDLNDSHQPVMQQNGKRKR